MSGDNTVINTGSLGDTIRDIDRSLNSPAISAKTQVMQLDAGGQKNESLVSGDNPLPVMDSSTRIHSMLLLRQLLTAQAGTNGFVPIETPAFLVG